MKIRANTKSVLSAFYKRKKKVILCGVFDGDINNISVKVARYQGLNRVDLVESNEYGYESLIKPRIRFWIN